jgi:hypothetical protein
MKTTYDKAVFCIAEDRTKAISILNSLRSSGFTESQISLITSKANGESDIELEGDTKAPEGTAAGASSGLVLGGALGWMVGIGALAIPGLGPFIAAGPLMAALAGAAIGSAAGGVTGALIGLGFSEYEAKQYESHLREGNSLISVSVASDEDSERARNIFENAGAKHISTQNVVSADRE